MREGLSPDFSERRQERCGRGLVFSQRVRKKYERKEGRQGGKGEGDRGADRTLSHASVREFFGAGTPAIPLSLKLVSSELRCLGIRLVKRLCCCCVGRIAGGNPRSLARRGRLSRLLQFKHNGGYLYRFKNKNDEKRKGKEGKREREEDGRERESEREGACEGGSESE